MSSVLLCSKVVDVAEFVFLSLCTAVRCVAASEESETERSMTVGKPTQPGCI